MPAYPGDSDRFTNNTVRALSTSRNGHAIDGATRIVPGCRVGYIVGTDHECDVRTREIPN